ncbi:zinc/manganese transport system substrate-binding protein [Microbacterium resistens]|uniref:Zinc/manganese transport system substrate-binding protein n=1 Tax=Microbacterium resistens TaxID=156977 RepID=A0ABU1SGX2_9MICO|nr:zinc ABC transporter substrate-binding protein [Microbacterium resistens]MDR6868851.1 zinc/manganese transport system substrate-binding protein [Microbacterium resistens]
MKKPLLISALVSVSALALAGCSAASSGPSATDDGRIDVVASTNVYGDIAAAIGGDRVRVTSVITSLTQDPHSYEASARDRLTVSGADLVITNGGGYDTFMDALLEGSKAPVIAAVEFSHDYPGNTGHDHAGEHSGAADDHAQSGTPTDGTPTDSAEGSADGHTEEGHADEHGDHAGHDHIEGFNEHVWFDPHTMTHMAEDVAHHLAEIDPEGAKTYEKGAADLTAQLAADEQRLDEVKQKAAGAGVFLTEPVPGYLATAAGLSDVAPAGFAEAVEEGRDVPPATLLAALDVVKGGGVRAVLTNSQTGGAETDKVVSAAKDAGIPVVAFTEILPEGKTYAEWMRDAIESLASAVGA